MKKILTFLIGLSVGVSFYPLSSMAVTVVKPHEGGTGTSTVPTFDQILIGGDTSGRYDVKTLTAGSNITIATTSGKVTISSTASGSGSGTVGTSTVPTVGQLSYWTSAGTPSLLGSVATTTVSAGTNMSFTPFVVIGNTPITINSTAVSGGTGGGTWSTTTSQTSGVLVNYPNNTSDVVVIGSNATTSAEYYFDPNTLQSYLSGKNTIDYASTTALTVSGTAYIGSLNGILKGTTGTIGTATAGVDYENPLTFSFPLIRSTNAISYGGLSTSSPAVIGNIPYFTGVNTFGNTATGTVSSGTGISVTAGQSIIGSGLTITNTASDQTVVLNNGTGISTSGTYPNFTIGVSAIPVSSLSNYDWTFGNTYGANNITASTSIPVWVKGQFNASSTSVFDNYIDHKAISTPTAPQAGFARLYAETTQGFTRFLRANEAATNIVLGRDNVFIAKNTTVSTIAKGSVVYITGSTGNVPNIGLAKADSSATLPAVGVALDAINANNFGQIMKLGILTGYNTSAYASGDSLWVSTTTAGALVNYRPKYPYQVARVATILSSGVSGSMEIITAPFVGQMDTGTNQASFSVGIMGNNGTSTINSGGVASILPYASTTMFTFATASTTALIISGSPSGLLKTATGGIVSNATAGVDYQAPISATWPITFSANTVGFNGLSTSSPAVTGNIPYFTGVNTFGNVATSTLTASSPLTGSFTQIGSGGSLGCQTASGAQAGCLSTADWTTFNNKWDLSSSTIGVAYGGTGRTSVEDGAILTGGIGGGSATLVALGTSTAGQILNIDPTTGRPAWKSFGGTNRVLYTSAVDTLASAANFSFDGTNLGLGTSTPQNILHLWKSAVSTSSVSNYPAGYTTAILEGGFGANVPGIGLLSSGANSNQQTAFYDMAAYDPGGSGLLDRWTIGRMGYNGRFFIASSTNYLNPFQGMTEALTILPSGYVGLNDNNPAKQLSVGGSALIGGALNVNGNGAGNGSSYINNNLGVGTTTPFAALAVKNGGPANSFMVEDVGGGPDNSPFVIDTAGNVGIATTTPTSLFSLGGAGQAFRIGNTGTVLEGVWNATPITYAYGGTGLTSYAQGDLIYASGINTLANLTVGGSGTCLTSNGTIPSWGSCGTGTFPFTTTTNFGQVANATTTALWLQGSPISLMASSTAVLTNATSTQLTVTGNLWLPSLASASNCLKTDAAGLVSQGACGAGSQTPWTSAIDGGGFALTNAGALTFTNFTATSTSVASSIAYRLGIGTTSPEMALTIASTTGSILPYEYLEYATSTTYTLDFSKGNQQLYRHGGTATTISFANTEPGLNVKFIVCNPNGTAGAITWPATSVLKWSGGVTPGQTTTAGNCDAYSFMVTQATSSTVVFGVQAAGF